MQTGNKQSQDAEILIGAIFIMLTNWDSMQARQGRRGEYLTTGALQLPRIRTIPETLKNSLMSTLNSIGLDANTDDISEMFSGIHEYQLSFAINRFESRKGEGIGLNPSESKAVATVIELMKTKPEAVQERLSPAVRKAS